MLPNHAVESGWKSPNVQCVMSGKHIPCRFPSSSSCGQPKPKEQPRALRCFSLTPCSLVFWVHCYSIFMLHNVYKYVLMIFDVCAFMRDFCICCVCRIVTYLDLWWLLVSNKDIHVIYLTHPQPTWMSPTSEVEIQSEPLWWPNFRSESLPRGRVKEGSTKNSRGSTQ